MPLLDEDCDSVLTVDDCDDSDHSITALKSDDDDADGIQCSDDCDDSDTFGVSQQMDPDCDGFYLGTNGYSVLCPNASIDSSGSVNGVVYNKRDESYLRSLRYTGSNEWDTICTSDVISEKSHRGAARQRNSGQRANFVFFLLLKGNRRQYYMKILTFRILHTSTDVRHMVCMVLRGRGSPLSASHRRRSWTLPLRCFGT